MAPPLQLRTMYVQTIMRQALAQALQAVCPNPAPELVALERPKVAAHGDYACTAAMVLARQLKQPPQVLAQRLREALLANPELQPWVDDVTIAGPGFLNLTLTHAARQHVVREVLQQGQAFGQQPATGQRVVVEFVSANPTGPLHVGHGRQAALGDAMCNLLQSQGWQVWREFYYNDAGGQIQQLTLSVQARLRGLAPGQPDWPEGAYNGEYIADIAQAFLAKQTVQADDRSERASGDVNDMEGIRRFAVAYLRHEQDLDLRAFGVAFDQYYLESSLYADGLVEQTVSKLQQTGHTYEADGALWLRSTDFGDDKDRVMRKSDGSYTYFVPDVAYHLTKWRRGFTQAINIQGSDHHGTVARVRAGLQAAGEGVAAGYPSYVLHTMVRVMRGGEEVKISKRAGSYVTLRDLIGWTSADAVRFFLLSRKPDTEYVFDIDLALAQNNDNPVFYVQYAHARIQSVLAQWGKLHQGQREALPHVSLAPLTTAPAQALMRALEAYPDVLAAAARDLAPHDITFYLRDLAAAYHRYYDAERVLVEDAAVRDARVALIAAVAQVLANALALLGVHAPQTM